jgi:predicted metal-dependent hydrolase
MSDKPIIRILNFSGRNVPVKIRRNARARRMILRVDSKTGGVIMTLPMRASEREAILMVQEKSSWLLSRIEEIPPRILFKNGAHIPLLGENHIIFHDPTLKAVAVKIDKRLHMGGRPEHLTRRLRDWLRGEAKAEIQPRAIAMAAQLERKIGRITVRDTKSRWGSCAPNGNLSFCWRLIMAPGWVLDYVVAHEVSHLRHMNHSPEFWKTVDSLGVRISDAKVWLNSNAEQLQRYG